MVDENYVFVDLWYRETCMLNETNMNFRVVVLKSMGVRLILFAEKKTILVSFIM